MRFNQHKNLFFHNFKMSEFLTALFLTQAQNIKQPIIVEAINRV